MDANNDDHFYLVPPGGDDIPPENPQPSQPHPNNPPEQSSLTAKLLARIQELEGQVRKNNQPPKFLAQGQLREDEVRPPFQ